MTNQKPTDIRIKQIAELVQPYCLQHGINKLAVFGSFARGSATADSDLDLLVNFRHPVSLLTQIRIQRELSDLLGLDVDLVTEQGLSPLLRDKVNSELKVLI